MKNKIPAVLIIILLLGGGQNLFAEPHTGGQVLIGAGEFVMGDTYCADEQKNSDWCVLPGETSARWEKVFRCFTI